MRSAFQQVSPGRLQIRDGGGCLSLFGLPFFAAGVFMLLACLQIIPFSNASEVPWYTWPLLGLMGVVFTAVGGALVFGRAWVVVDSMQRTVIKQWGLLVPMHATTYRLDGYTAVRLEFKRGDSDTADQYPVTLKGSTGPDLSLFSSQEYAESRSRALAIAQALHLEIEDASTDHPTRLPAGQADLSLQHRLRVERQPAVSRPASMRSEVTRTNGGVQIVIPAPNHNPIMFLIFLLPLAIPVFFMPPLHAFFRATNTPDVVGWVFLGFLFFGFFVLPATSALNAFLRSRLGRTIVSATQTGIRIEERRIVRTRELASLAAADILDVDYSTTDSMIIATRQHADDLRRSNPRWQSTDLSPRVQRIIAAIARFAKGGGITIKTKQGLTSFGQGLDDDEIRYLHSVVRQALVSGAFI